MNTATGVEPGHQSRMAAHARVRAELAPAGPARSRTRLSVLRSQAPLKLRPAIAGGREPYAAYADDPGRVCLAAAAAGPVGGDDLLLEVEVGSGSTLVLTEASATLLLPGVDGARSRTRVRVRVESGATFVWLPEPVIAARDCRHLNDVVVEMSRDARLLMREELLLGRRGEAPGSLYQHVRVRRDDRTLHAQELRIGARLEASPAVVGSHRAVGSMIVVDPGLTFTEAMPLGGDGVLLPLAGGSAVLAHALAADSIALRRQLDAARTALGAPWDPRNGSVRAGQMSSIEEAG